MEEPHESEKEHRHPGRCGSSARAGRMRLARHRGDEAYHLDYDVRDQHLFEDVDDFVLLVDDARQQRGVHDRVR